MDSTMFMAALILIFGFFFIAQSIMAVVQCKKKKVKSKYRVYHGKL
jgi:hypothetical protein